MSPGHAPSGTVVAWVFVAVQAVLIVLMVLGPRPEGFHPGGSLRLVGGAMMGIGTLVGIWAAVYLGRGLTPSPLPNGATDLVTAGPYRWVRHPMYTAVMILMAGVTLRAGSWLLVVELAGLVVLFNLKARWEETQLAGTFPGYGRYAESVNRFVPGPA